MLNNQNITEKGKSLAQYAMHYGVYLGLFWIIQYSLKAAADAGFSDRFKYLFYLLNIGAFLLIYIFTLRYRESTPQKKLSILRCTLFVVLMCFFASFFEGAAMYAHYKFIDPAYFDRMTTQMIHMSDSLYDSISFGDTEAMKETARAMYSNKAFYIFATFIGNIFFGAFLGLIMGLLVNLRKTN